MNTIPWLRRCSRKFHKLYYAQMRGFTLTELIVAVLIFSILLTIVVINLINVKQNTSLLTTVNLLVVDMRQQQMKAIVGDTQGSGTRSDFGIHLNTTSYVLFRGSTYSPVSPTNLTVQLGDSIEAVSAGTDIIFQQMSGEPTGGALSIVLTDAATGEQRTLTVNRYGVVTAVN